MTSLETTKAMLRKVSAIEILIHATRFPIVRCEVNDFILKYIYHSLLVHGAAQQRGAGLPNNMEILLPT